MFALRKLIIASSLLTLLGCTQNDTEERRIDTLHLRYKAEIRWTEYGIPHITADNFGSLGYGEAYAASRDNVCNMAVSVLNAKGESAKHFGAGHENKNIYNDAVVKALDMTEKGQRALESQPAEIREWLEGYAAGYNRYLKEARGEFNSWCNGASWVTPLTAADFMTQYTALVQTLPRIAGALVAAQPPIPADTQTEIVVSKSTQIAALEAVRLEGMGSNGWAFGRSYTENGKGALLANPHYPWYGTSRFWEKHLTIPGELDVYGAGLIGTPGVSIGFNEAIAWTHTVSDSKRTTFYRLQLNPENPMQYLYEGEWRDIEAREIKVEIAADDGITAQSIPVWFSQFGPMVAMPGLEWTTNMAYSVRDANAENALVLAQWLAMGRARSMDEFIAAHQTYNAMPWVNTISTSADGRAVYLDNSSVGALSTEAIAAWQQSLAAMPQLKGLYLTKGLVILDGGSKRDEWLELEGATVAGTTRFNQRPFIESDRYVFNSNDSYWLSDPANPNTNYSPLYGATQTPRSVRTRMNIHLLEGMGAFDFRGEDGLFSIADIQNALFDNSGLTAHLLKPALVAACEGQTEIELEGRSVDLSKACETLQQWDNRYDSESRGAVLFREWLTRYDYNDTLFAGKLFAKPFDPSKAVQTPHTLADADTSLTHLAEAVELLRGNDIPLDVSLGELQKGHRANQAFKLHGGNRFEGIANLQVTTPFNDSPIFQGSNTSLGDSRTLTKSGYNVAHGSSFIMALAFTEQGPEAEAILSYSQSGAPGSKYFADQTALYSHEEWRPIYFKANEVLANTQESVELSE
jgi:acyl-homoserine-lactone acylase